MITSRRFASLLLLVLKRKVFEMDGDIVEVTSISEHGLVTVRRLIDGKLTDQVEPRRLK